MSFVLVNLVLIPGASAQSIRKPWREMTSAERADYVNAINTLYARNPNIIERYVADHQAIAIHNADGFLPWHRMFIYYFEQEFKAINSEINMPYWDWAQSGDWSSSSLLFRSGPSSSSSTNGLLGQPYSWSNNVTRIFGSTPQPTRQSLTNLVNNNATYSTFRNALEYGPHAAGHVWIGGTMDQIPVSPRDPTFYLHHTMVDKVWEDWVIRHWRGGTIPDLPTSMPTVTGQPNRNANTIIDSRSLKVWYAFAGQVSLNRYSVSGSEVYRYTGRINAENEFRVPSSTTCQMVSSSEVVLNPGFTASNGCTFTARIDANSFNSRTDNSIAGKYESMSDQVTEEVPVTDLTVFPNPSSGMFNITLPSAKNELYQIVVYDMVGRVIASTQQDSNQFVLDLSNQVAGVYVLKAITNNQQRFTQKLILN